MAALLCAACLLIGLPHPSRSCADETAIISSTPASQMDPNSLRPSANTPVAPAPYQAEQNTNQTEPPRLKEYMDASEEISLFGIDLRIERRKAEKEVQGLRSSISRREAREPARDCILTANPRATFSMGLGCWPRWHFRLRQWWCRSLNQFRSARPTT
jgi:hypothetical protein